MRARKVLPAVAPEPGGRSRGSRLRRRVMLAGSCTTLAAASLGLSYGTSAATASRHGGSLTTVTIGVAAPAAEMTLPFLAQKEGYFRKLGINAVVTMVPASTILSAISGGTIDFAVNGAPQPEIGVSQGAPIRWIALWSARPSLRIVVDGNIKTWKDLEGKSFGVSSPGSLSEILTERALEEHGVNPSLVKFDFLGGPPPTLAAFVSGEISADIFSPPVWLEEVKKVPGAHALYDLATGPAWPNAGLVAYMPWATAHRRVTDRVLQALSEALTTYKKHSPVAISEIEAIVPGLDHQLAKDAWSESLPILSSSMVPTRADEAPVKAQLDKTYPKLAAVPASGFFDLSFLKGAGLMKS